MLLAGRRQNKVDEWESVFSLLLASHFSSLLLAIGSILHSSPHAESVFPMTAIGE